jgi:hypothetical protein
MRSKSTIIRQLSSSSNTTKKGKHEKYNHTTHIRARAVVLTQAQKIR